MDTNILSVSTFHIDHHKFDQLLLTLYNENYTAFTCPYNLPNALTPLKGLVLPWNLG